MRGVPSEVALDEIDGMKGPCAVSLHNAVAVSQGRLGEARRRLGDDRLVEVCAAPRFLLEAGAPGKVFGASIAC